jgi:putative Holliday junction resolvase
VTAEAPLPPRVALAFDYGAKITGVACGDTLTRRAHPRAALRASGGEPDWRAIGSTVRELGPDVLVVGSPRNVDASASPMTHAARAFARELALRFHLPVEEVDERWSSLEAAAGLKARRASGERRRRVSREDLDSAAAAVILERWFAGEGRRLEAPSAP